MHSGTHIKRSNHQKKLVLEGLEAGQSVTLTPVGSQVGSSFQRPIEAIANGTVLVIDGNRYEDYMGSLVSYNGKLHTLDLPQPEEAAA
jgi:hypothetical protein